MEVENFKQYVAMVEEKLQVTHPPKSLQREDSLTVDTLFIQFVENYVVLREFLMELSCVIFTRGEHSTQI